MKNSEENQILTVGMFKSIFEPAMAKIDERFEQLDRKMMDGFAMLDRKIDLVDQYSRERDGDLSIQFERLAIDKRLTRLEARLA
ncbi:MAG TPA: hypothetical protein VFQ72_03180 [Candidatus Paceibacterota bacterium]|nr:hypothetical protein [Candidatus Paceibacterota bacterium]